MKDRIYLKKYKNDNGIGVIKTDLGFSWFIEYEEGWFIEYPIIYGHKKRAGFNHPERIGKKLIEDFYRILNEYNFKIPMELKKQIINLRSGQ